MIYRALKITDQRKGDGRQYTIFSDSASAVDRTRSDSTGHGQRLAMATHEVSERIVGRNSTVTIRWTPAHQGVEGNETADSRAKAAAEGRPPGRPGIPTRDQPIAHDKKGDGG